MSNDTGSDHDDAGETSPKRVLPRRAKASKTLPTPRVKVEKQLEVLRAYAAKSGVEKKPVTNAEVAEIVGMVASTVSLVNPFLVDVGLLRKGDGGHVPADEAFNYARAMSFKSANPAHKLGPALRRSWFYERLAPNLQVRSTIPEADAIAALAEEAEANAHHQTRLAMLIEYLSAAGLVQRENGSLVMPDPTATLAVAPKDPPTDPPADQDATTPPPRAARTFAPSAATAPEGAMQFHATINVTMAELATWAPDRIAAFMSGLASVIAAQGGREQPRRP